MSSTHELNAARISPPEKTFRLATTGSSVAYKLPRTFIGNYITLFAVTADAFVAISTDSAVVATASGTSGTDGDGYITPVTDGAKRVPAGEERSFDLSVLLNSVDSSNPLKELYLAVITDGTAGELEINQTSGRA